MSLIYEESCVNDTKEYNGDPKMWTHEQTGFVDETKKKNGKSVTDSIRRKKSVKIHI